MLFALWIATLVLAWSGGASSNDDAAARPERKNPPAQEDQERKRAEPEAPPTEQPGPKPEEGEDEFLDAIADGKMNQWMVSGYLGATGRKTWVDAKAFVETGLRGGGPATEAFAGGIAFLRDRPDKAYIERLIADYELSDQTVGYLKQRYGIKTGG
jgi:hypothetical protein